MSTHIRCRSLMWRMSAFARASSAVAVVFSVIPAIYVHASDAEPKLDREAFKRCEQASCHSKEDLRASLLLKRRDRSAASGTAADTKQPTDLPSTTPVPAHAPIACPLTREEVGWNTWSLVRRLLGQHHARVYDVLIFCPCSYIRLLQRSLKSRHQRSRTRSMRWCRRWLCCTHAHTAGMILRAQCKLPQLHVIAEKRLRCGFAHNTTQ